ncbi:hypothetical protein F4859DRAFT_524442 [Xylaria cf. heliscus]|nr:hypothetical protein F4859DRAFT_524442 [Xylaria cf. heliscus]
MEDFAVLFNSLSPQEQEELLNGPASPPPAGIVPNFDSPSNQNGLATGVTTTGFVAIILVVMLWSFAKISCQKRFYVADGFIVASFGIVAGYMYTVYRWIHLTGMYVHIWNLVYLSENFYGSTAMTVKISILLEWARIFVPRGVHNKFWWTCQVTLAVNVSFYVAVKLVDNLACFPHRKIWDITVEGHCINMRASSLASSIVNLVSDIVIFALPQSVIWNLSMRTANKIGVSCMFALGIFCCIASVFRVVTSYKYYISTDFTYDISSLALWNVVEITLMFAIACLPSIPVLFRRPWIQQFITSSKSLIRSGQDSRANPTESHQVTQGTSTLANGNPYRQFEEHNLSIFEHMTQGTSYLQQPAERISGGPDISAENGIIFTTNFIAHGTQDGNTLSNIDAFRVYHPWARFD